MYRLIEKWLSEPVNALLLGQDELWRCVWSSPRSSSRSYGGVFLTICVMLVVPVGQLLDDGTDVLLEVGFALSDGPRC